MTPHGAAQAITAVVGAVSAFPPLTVCEELAADLYELHADEVLSLDTWVAAREFVEHFRGPIQENGL